MRWLLVFLLLFNVAWAAEQDYVVATVGDQKVYFSEIQKAAAGLNKFLKENFETSRDWKLDFIRQYVARQALAKRAEREGLEKDKDVQYSFEQAKRSILADKLLFDQINKISISESDVKNFYEQNKAKYQTPEGIKISYIKVKGKAEADKIAERLNKGESFEKIGKKDIVKIKDLVRKGAPPMAGELMAIPPEGLNGLFSLGAGGCSQPVEATSQKGPSGEFYIFRIDEKEPAKDRPYDEVKQQVEFEYGKSVRDKAINDFIMETFKSEKVTINEGEIK